MITGSAPIDAAVLDFLKVCFCCPMLEGYGLTETSGGSSVTHPRDPVTGHVGGPLPCIKWRLMDVPEMSYLSSDKPYPRGELQMYGPAVFSGYFKRADKTSEAFDAEGWFKTGDVAMAYPNGSVKIIDRSKNIFKLSQGEYIAPEKLENMFALSPWVAQSIVYGDSLRSCAVAIVCPNMDAVQKWAASNGKADMKEEDLLNDALLKKTVLDALVQVCTENKCTSLEKPKDLHLTAEAFTVENNLLTPTYKLKRNIARDFFKPQIDAMYAELIKKGL